MLTCWFQQLSNPILNLIVYIGAASLSRSKTRN